MQIGGHLLDGWICEAGSVLCRVGREVYSGAVISCEPRTAWKLLRVACPALTAKTVFSAIFLPLRCKSWQLSPRPRLIRKARPCLLKGSRRAESSFYAVAG